MRKLIIKYFALDYLIRFYNRNFNVVRPATITAPLAVLAGLFTNIFTISLFIISCFFGFIYFKIKPVKWEELDFEQKWMYGKAAQSGLVKIEFNEEQKEEWKELDKYIRLVVKQNKFYRPLLIIYHPIIFITIGIILAFLIL